VYRDHSESLGGCELRKDVSKDTDRIAKALVMCAGTKIRLTRACIRPFPDVVPRLAMPRRCAAARSVPPFDVLQGGNE
jgi:hypothetical protein